MIDRFLGRVETWREYSDDVGDGAMEMSEKRHRRTDGFANFDPAR